MNHIRGQLFLFQIYWQAGFGYFCFGWDELYPELHKQERAIV